MSNTVTLAPSSSSARTTHHPRIQKPVGASDEEVFNRHTSTVTRHTPRLRWQTREGLRARGVACKLSVYVITPEFSATATSSLPVLLTLWLALVKFCGASEANA